MQQTVSSKQHPFLRLLAYLNYAKPDYCLATLFSVLNKIFDIFPEILIGGAVDIVVNRQQSWLGSWFGVEDITQQLIYLSILTSLIWGLESLFQYLASVKWRNLAQMVENKLRQRVYEHIQACQLNQIEATPTGQLTSIINDDINQLERFLESGLDQIIQLIASSLLIGLVFLWCSPWIAVFTALPIPFVLIGAFLFQDRLRPHFLRVREKAAAINAGISNNLQALMTIKSHGAETREAERIAKLSQDYQIANQQMIKISSMVTPVIRIIILVGFICALFIGGYKTLHGEMNVGIFSLLVFLSQRLLWPFSYLADISVNFQRVMASVTRALDLLTWPVEPSQTTDVILKQSDFIAEFHIEQVSFSYPGTNSTVLHDINLTIPAGKTVAIVGGSGSGKSTLIKLLCRFYESTQGSIRVGEHQLTDLNKTWWRKQIALVSQDTHLFSGSILENLVYGNPDAGWDKIKHAVEVAGLTALIESYEQGYETRIGERGLSLSGGQRQRIAIARALIKETPILIFDEATSAVDNETERLIQQALNQISQDKTMLMIAHRLSTIRHADMIAVLEKGRIVETGDHDSLLAKQGRYADLWALQVGEDL